MSKGAQHQQSRSCAAGNRLSEHDLFYIFIKSRGQLRRAPRNLFIAGNRRLEAHIATNILADRLMRRGGGYRGTDSYCGRVKASLKQ